MSSGATRATKDRYLFRPIQNVSEDVELIVRRADRRHGRVEMDPRLVVDGFSHRHIAGNGDHCHTTLGNRGLHGNLEYAGHLFGLRNQFTVVATLSEQIVRMSLLKIAAADFLTRNLSCNGKNGNAAAMAVVKTID